MDKNTCEQCGCTLLDTEDDVCNGCIEDDDRTYEERRQDDLEYEYENCHCGSLQLLKNGEIIRIADCIC